MPQFTSDRRIYLNTDKSAVVDEDSPDAAFLLVAEGGVVSEEDAKKYGLKAPAKAAEPEPGDDPNVMSESKAVKQSQVEDKSIAGPKR